jgi:hypothetical protein
MKEHGIEDHKNDDDDYEFKMNNVKKFSYNLHNPFAPAPPTASLDAVTNHIHSFSFSCYYYYYYFCCCLKIYDDFA